MKNILIAALLLATTTVFAQKKADVLVANAIEQAVKQDKQVFIMFHASWCSWCKKMDDNMNNEKVKAFFEDSFVIEHITVLETPKNKKLENPGGEILMESYGGKGSGLPFWAILDKDGNLITNALDENGENLGCPASPAEVASFISKLKDHVTRDSKVLRQVRDVFTQ